MLLAFTINDKDPELGIFEVDTFEMVAALKENEFERTLTWDATLTKLDSEAAFPLDSLRINVVSERHTVAMHAEFSMEIRGVKLDELNPMPSTVRLIAPELGAFLRTNPETSTRCTEPME
jgi:hypothetical protein